MKTKMNFAWKALMGLAFISAISVPALAHHGRKAAFQQCAQQVTGGQVSDPSQLSADQRSQIHQCVHARFQAFHQAVKACLNEKQIALPPHQRGQKRQLDPATQAVLNTCKAEVKQAMKQAQSSGAAPASVN